MFLGSAGVCKSEVVPKPKLIEDTSRIDEPEETGGVASITDRLNTLKILEEAGLIIKEEAAAKRQEILKKL
jgi:hypothetical protein